MNLGIIDEGYWLSVATSMLDRVNTEEVLGSEKSGEREHPRGKDGWGVPVTLLTSCIPWFSYRDVCECLRVIRQRAGHTMGPDSLRS